MITSRYDQLIVAVFEAVYAPGSTSMIFRRELITECAAKLGVALPKNLGDIIYSYRYRRAFPNSILQRAPVGLEWVIRPAGDGIYRFVAVRNTQIVPRSQMVVTKIPDSTPGIIAAYALDDEQALLAKLRYNRLVDTFLRVTCYSLQNHLRTKLSGRGQIEVDELYLGVDRIGAQYVIPVQAKAKKDRHSVVQIEQDMELCRGRFPELVCRSVGAQFMPDGVIALMEFGMQDEEVCIVNECHFRLVPHADISKAELRALAARSPGT